MKLLASFLYVVAPCGLVAGMPLSPTWTSNPVGLAGADGEVHAFITFDDGNGPALYVGGEFTSIGGVSASGIAKWDGVGWSEVAGGVQTPLGQSGAVYALEVFDDGKGAALFVAGAFVSAGGSPANRIAKWDGQVWSPLGSGTNSRINALAVYDDGSGHGPALFVGGHFWMAGGLLSDSLAIWDGQEWSQSPTGILPGSGYITAFTVFDDGRGDASSLIVGGQFLWFGSGSTHLGRWDGSRWSSMGSVSRGSSILSGPGTRVTSLAAFDDGSGSGEQLYVGGDFTKIEGTAVSHIARWDGLSWSSLGAGVSGSGQPNVEVLSVFDGGQGGGPSLIVGGDFDSAGSVAAGSIARWDGSTWSALGTGAELGGTDPIVRSLGAISDVGGVGPTLYVGGSFTLGSQIQNLAQWDGSNWSGVASPFGSFCTAKSTVTCGVASISASGTPSAAATSGFVVQAGPVRGCRAGLLLYSSQPTVAGSSFGGPGNGVLCLTPSGLRRAGPIDSGGTSPQTCDGVLSIDMNQFQANNWTASGCAPAPGQNSPAGFLGTLGVTVRAQMYGRDSISTGQVLTAGFCWTTAP